MGLVNRVQGKTKLAALLLGKGGIIDAVSGISAVPRVVGQVALAVTATANTDITASLPAGAIILGMSVITTTAFTAATDAKIQIGSSAGDSSYVATTTIKALGVFPLTLVAAAAAALANFPAGSPNLFIRIVQTGSTTAVGAAVLLIDYVTLVP